MTHHRRTTATRLLPLAPYRRECEKQFTRSAQRFLVVYGWLNAVVVITGLTSVALVAIALLDEDAWWALRLFVPVSLVWLVAFFGLAVSVVVAPQHDLDLIEDVE